MSTDDDRRQELWARWGRPDAFDLARACELLGKPPTREAAAFRYASLEAAAAYAESNKEHHGLESTWSQTPEGVIGIVYLPMPRKKPMRGWTHDGAEVELTPGQERVARALWLWAQGIGGDVCLPHVGRQGGKSVILATVAKMDRDRTLPPTGVVWEQGEDHGEERRPGSAGTEQRQA